MCACVSCPEHYRPKMTFADWWNCQMTSHDTKVIAQKCVSNVPCNPQAHPLFRKQPDVMYCNARRDTLCERKNEKSTPLGVMTGASVPRSSPRQDAL